MQYHEPAIQQAAAFALHEALIVHSEVASLTLQCLIDLYYELKEVYFTAQRYLSLVIGFGFSETYFVYR